MGSLLNFDHQALCKKQRRYFNSFLVMVFVGLLGAQNTFAQSNSSMFRYVVSIPDPQNHNYNVELNVTQWSADTITLKMPNWMPGYYQFMNYAADVENLTALDAKGNKLGIDHPAENTWVMAGVKNQTFKVSYTIATQKQFVANSYVDSAHAYLVPGNTFLYADGFIDAPVEVKVDMIPAWNKIATGLGPLSGNPNAFYAPNFDILYDCPLLIGNLDTLSSFNVNGIEHRFIGYQLGTFNRELFIRKLKKAVESAVSLMGEIPYKQYTFIGIGPGFGGIEHLNNTTISFDGNGLDDPESMIRALNYLAHEYFHHYNVKRIRPYELGPFDYESGNKTNQLWVAEGLTVYYEYLIMKRANLIDKSKLLDNLAETIEAVENDSGRFYQSLLQSSYSTWDEGPFGYSKEKVDKSISYYVKGPVVGWLFDLEIRHATNNAKSLDDVMRLLYSKYYKQLQRGFTEAEFQQTCEQVAGKSLTPLFEYVYTTKELDYNQYLKYAGLHLDSSYEYDGPYNTIKKFKISQTPNPDALQVMILQSWLGE